MKFDFEREGYRYELDVDLGDFTDTALSIAIRASRTPIIKQDRLREFSVSASVSIVARETGPFLVVKIEGVTVFEEPMDEILGTSHIMNRIPSHLYGGGDPFMGCLIRAGLSASIDQVRMCWRQTRDAQDFWEHLRAAYDCVRENLPRLGMRAAMRAGWCIARIGF